MAVTTSFRCGHERSADNVLRNGGTATRCRTCHVAKEVARKLADPESFRIVGRDRMRKHRGGLHGHANGRKDSCPANHPYDVENTYWFEGSRQCKTCRRAASTAWYHAKRTNGGDHTEAEWLELCTRYNHRCLRCGDEAPLTRDHVIPVTLGGSNAIENLQPLCRPCNSAKGNRNTTDYRPAMAAV